MEDTSNTEIEDEWSSLRKRFESKGINWKNLEESDRTLQIWRWLVDAESNLKTSRHINDKLRTEHFLERKEINDYSEHIRVKCEGRVRGLEEEVRDLKNELEELLVGTEAVSDTFMKEGLENMANSALGNQVAYLLEERGNLLRERLHFGGTHPFYPSQVELRTAVSKVDPVSREIIEAPIVQADLFRLEKPTKSLHQEKADYNEKLNGALREISEKESIIKGLEEKVSLLRNEDATLSLPSNLVDLNCLSRRPSNSQNSFDVFRQESAEKLGSFFDEKILDSKCRLSQLQEIKKLQNEVQILREDSSSSWDKYEKTLKEYQTFKIETRNDKSTLKKEMEIEREHLLNKVEQFKREQSIKDKELESTQDLLRQMTDNIEDLRAYRLDVIKKMRESEQNTKCFQEEVSSLRQRIKLVESTNIQLTEKLRENMLANILRDS